MGAQCFLKTVIKATINPPIPQAINRTVFMVLNVKDPVPTSKKRLMAVLLTVPLMVIVSVMFVALLKVLFDKTGFPDLKERCLLILVRY